MRKTLFFIYVCKKTSSTVKHGYDFKAQWFFLTVQQIEKNSEKDTIRRSNKFDIKVENDKVGLL